MENKDLQNITLKIFQLQKPISLVIEKQKEGAYREAAKKLSKAIEYYKNKHIVNDLETIIAMAGLNFAISSVESRSYIENDSFMEELEKINNNLDAYLENEKSI